MSDSLLIQEITDLRNQLSDSKKLAEYRLEEIKRLMFKDPRVQIATVYGVPLDHYANFLMAIEERSADKADKVLARLSEAEAENARLTRAVAFEKANTQESSDNGARWRWQYEQEVARRDEAIRKREEAERANLKMVNVLTRFSEQGPYTDDSGDCGFCQTPSYEGEAEVNPQAHEVGCLWRDADALLPAPEKKSQEEA